MNRPVHFEIPADNVERACAFFTQVFAWKIEKWPGPFPYWNVTTGDSGPGINGAIMNRQHPGQPIVTSIDVTDLDATAQAIAAHGGQIVVPKMAVPTVGWLLYFKDSEGNIHGAWQADPHAA
jgi:predicted enzyme related to lactoylglutathione lyase